MSRLGRISPSGGVRQNVSVWIAARPVGRPVSIQHLLSSVGPKSGFRRSARCFGTAPSGSRGSNAPVATICSNMPPSLERIVRVSLREHIYQLLRAMIVSGRLASGARIDRRRLASELGVSTTPVRHVLYRLEQEGLVRIEARRGVFVTSGTPAISPRPKSTPARQHR
ncbi:GntR family transcriptional regulator [Bosea sp. (in: a-proteobacteria)]|uniref:GntR family transcriptional regulator n=1 Tax=Bosea sp. (in: a-proteobacteria) TaxID=1871050 RepID=UPI0039C8B258